MSKKQKWADLAPRVASAVVMIVLGGAALWAGGIWFVLLGLIVVGLMLWELVRMIAPGHPVMAWQIAGLGAATLAISLYVPGGVVPLILGLFLIVSVGRVGQKPKLLVLYTAGIWLAGFGLISLRSEAALLWTIWLVCVVVLTDIAGYFAGRLIGGPKFWPAISPKKTWSGTVAGWVCAGLFSAWIVYHYQAPAMLVLGGVLLSLASQMGDIAESALKRRMGVKDSSNLIPGHGGVMDRFDGMMGAALLVAFWWMINSMVLSGGGL